MKRNLSKTRDGVTVVFPCFRECILRVKGTSYNLLDVGVAATGISRHLFSSIFTLENEWNAAKKERRAGNEEIFLFALRFAYRMNVRQLRGYRYFYPKLVAIPGGSLPVFSSYFEKEKMDVGPKIFRLAPRYVGSEAVPMSHATTISRISVACSTILV